MFAPPIGQPSFAQYSLPLFGIRIPLMLMSYLGALKTWLYALVFQFFEPSRWSVRVPMVLLVGVGTLWLTWFWTRRVAGTRATIFTVALLALTDSIFILTNTFDWGPVRLPASVPHGRPAGYSDLDRGRIEEANACPRLFPLGVRTLG